MSPTVPMLPGRFDTLGCLPTCEAVSWALEESALRAVVLRKVVSALHRTHADEKLVSWANCDHPHCRLAHDALEGRMKLAGPNQWGVRKTVVAKEA